MKKNGFTLIELIAAMVLIVIIAIFTIPQIQNQISNKKQEINDANLQIIYSAAELYMEAKEIKRNSEIGDIYCVTLDKLINNGYLKEKVIDFTNGNEKQLSDYVVVSINSYNEYSNYSIKSTCIDDNNVSGIVVN